MDQDVVVNLSTGALTLAFKVALPVLGVGLVVGLIVSVFQAVTQIQEQTLVFIPKILALAAVLVIGGAWMRTHPVKSPRPVWAWIPPYAWGLCGPFVRPFRGHWPGGLPPGLRPQVPLV